MSIRYLDDYEEQCKRCKGECGVEGMSGCIVCHGFAPMTNADRIRSMSDEELAEWIANDLIEPGYYKTGVAEEIWLKWLKEEVSDA